MIRYALRAGEHLAIAPDAIKRDADGFFLMLGPDTPENERRGSVAIVHIRGALSHYKTSGGESYEAILERVGAALAEEEKPSAVVFRIESPGGVVAGLDESVRKLRRMSAESGVPFVAFVDEMAASAAYAMCCACEEIYAPKAAIIGSIGVISTMVSQVKADEMMGVEFRLITSGARKADGHVHAPITDAAVAAETRRNTELAKQFFLLASEARGVAPKTLAGLEASIFLGKEAASVGLIDDVWSFDELVAQLDVSDTGAPVAVAPNKGNETDRRARKTLDKVAQSESASTVAQPGTRGCATGDKNMSVKLAALITKTAGALASEKDAKRRAALQAQLAAYESTRAAMSDDDDGDEDEGKGDDDGDEDESKAKKAAKKADEAKRKAAHAKHMEAAAKHKQKAAEYEEKAKKCLSEEEDEEEESEEEAAAQLANPSTMSAGALAAVTGQADIAAQAMARVEKLEAEAAARTHKALVDEALAARRITPGEAKTLGKKPLAFVRDFLEMRPKAIVNVDDDAIRVPDGTPHADLGAEILKSIDTAILSANLSGDAAQKMRDALIQSHRERLAVNGAGRH